MKKLLLISFLSLFFSFSKGQVGINTETPNTTLEIKSSPNNLSLIDGIIIPKLTASDLGNKSNLYTEKQHSALVYVIDGIGIVNTKTEHVTGSGYYFYDQLNATSAGRWRKINLNIYNSDGKISDAIRNVEIGNNSLNFNASSVNAFSIDGSTFSVDASNNRIGIGTNKPEKPLDILTTTSKYGWQHSDGSIKLNSFIGKGNGNTTGGWIGTSTNHGLIIYTNNSAKLNIDNNGSVVFGNIAPSNRNAHTTFEIETRSNANVADGLLIPKTTPDILNLQNDMYTESQDGTLIYVTRGNGTANTKTKNINSKGFYYYDHALRSWIKLGTSTNTSAKAQTTENLTNIVTSNYTVKSDDEIIVSSANLDVNILFENIKNIEVGKKILLFNKNSDAKKLIITGVLGLNEITHLKGTTIIWDGINWLNIGT